MKKTLYQEPSLRVIKISGDVIATSNGNGMEDWGSAGTGGGSLNNSVQGRLYDEEEYF